LLAAKKQGIPIAEYTPLEVKMAITGYGKADKNQIQQMVKAILSLSEIPKPDDAPMPWRSPYAMGKQGERNNMKKLILASGSPFAREKVWPDFLKALGKEPKKIKFCRLRLHLMLPQTMFLREMMGNILKILVLV